MKRQRVEYKRARVLKEGPASFEIKDTDAQTGTFSGYASVFNVVDSYREIVAPGAFKKSLKRLDADKTVVPALWQHRSAEPIGGYSELHEDDKGLYVEGFLLKDEIPEARKAFVMMQKRIVTGLSIGYYVLDDSYNEKERIRTLRELELVEVSIVTFPANPQARGTVKSRLAEGKLPSMRDFEEFLRDEGFSITQAREIASHGLKHLLGAVGPRSLIAPAQDLSAQMTSMEQYLNTERSSL